MATGRIRGRVTWVMEGGTVTVPNGGNVDVTTSVNMRQVDFYNPGANSITITFDDEGGVTHTQILPPASTHSFGVNLDHQKFDVTFNLANAGGADIDVIWNASTVEGAA